MSGTALQPAMAAPSASDHEASPEVVLLLDPSWIDPGNSPNRAASAMEDQELEALALSVLLSQGNQQPIHVRRLEQPHGTYQYALISGARRLRVCARHQLPVKALVVDVTPEQALISRLIENHLRAPLSPWELGQQVAHIKAQHSELSLRKLANQIGIDVSMVHKALDIAALPPELVNAFANVSDIRYGDAKKLKDWVSAAPNAVLETAKALHGQNLPAKQVLEQLGRVAQGGDAPDTGVEQFN